MLAIVVLINILAAIVSYLGILGIGGRITGVMFVSIALCAMIVVNIIADYVTIRSLFSAPSGYTVMLAPVKSRQVLSGSILSIVLWDTVSLVIGIAGVVYHSLRLGEVYFPMRTAYITQSLWGFIIIFLNYILLITAIFFIAGLSKSILYRFRGRTFFAIIITMGIMYVLSMANLVLMPFGYAQRYGSFISINLVLGWNFGMVLYLLLCLGKIALFFGTTSYLMERKINI